MFVRVNAQGVVHGANRPLNRSKLCKQEQTIEITICIFKAPLCFQLLLLSLHKCICS